jgi:branched-chain amino acid transport system ATP-binding protein
LLDICKAQVGYGEIEVLHGISLTIGNGKITTIVGGNGAGKSTLLKAISGLIPLTAGRIEFEGVNLTNQPSHRVVDAGIAHIPEGRRLFPLQTVRENLELGAYVGRARAHLQQSLEEIYALFPVLKSRERQRAGTLSGGEQQMVTIGRGLMSRPKLVMFDEPSLGLAPQMVRETFEIIRRIRENGKTVLLVEQNVQQSLQIADYAFVLENGHLVLAGEAKELLRSPHVKKAYLGI